MLYEHERAIAIEAVLKASRLCLNIQHDLASDEKIAKSDRSPVTVADFGSQALIVAHLLHYFPHDPIVGEEEASVLRQDDQTVLKNNVIQRVNAIEPALNEQQILDAIDYGVKTCDFTQRYWTLDPIDGTKGFLRGDQYAVALALVEKGELVLGVLGCPNLLLDTKDPDKGNGCLFVAVKGQGAVMRSLDHDKEVDIHVDAITQPENAIFCESVESGHSLHDTHTKIAELLRVTAPPYRIDSQCKYAAVARGDASIYLRLITYRSWIWDQAAGAVIVQEAGGTVTDMNGKALDFSQGRRLQQNSGVIATNGKLHHKVIAAVQQVSK